MPMLQANSQILLDYIDCQIGIKLENLIKAIKTTDSINRRIITDFEPGVLLFSKYIWSRTKLCSTLRVRCVP